MYINWKPTTLKRYDIKTKEAINVESKTENNKRGGNGFNLRGMRKWAK